MKIAIITDTHWGVRNDNPLFHDNSKKFLDDVFFPYLRENGIDAVVHAGDLLDRRKYVNYSTAYRLKKDFLEPLNALGIPCFFIVGNHDSYYKNTIEVNALGELISDRYENISVIDRPTELRTILKTEDDVLLLPWICDDNREACMSAVASSTSPIVIGHLELAGFEMYRGSMVSHGDDPRLFDRFDMVISGHYHHRSTNGHVYYLGAHAEFTWSDYDDDRGFNVLDTSRRQLTLVRNPYTLFEKLKYDDARMSTDDVVNMDFSSLSGKIVKVVVINRTNQFTFETLISRIEQAGVHELQVVEDHLNLDLSDEDQDIIDEAESTLVIFKKYIEGAETLGVSRDALERVITDLYSEAMTLE